jgi:hypothetical protein
MLTGMEVAALIVVPVLAVLISGYAAWHARKSANEAKRVADIDEARRHDERAPTIKARYGRTRWEASQTADVPVVWFDLVDAPDEISKAEVELVVRDEAQQPPILAIARAEAGAPEERRSALFCPIKPGQERLLRVVRHHEHVAGTAAFRVTCAISSGENWTVPVRCEVSEPRRSRYRGD